MPAPKRSTYGILANSWNIFGVKCGYITIRGECRETLNQGPRIIPTNHTHESYPESYPRIIPPSQTSRVGHGILRHTHIYIYPLYYIYISIYIYILFVYIYIYPLISGTHQYPFFYICIVIHVYRQSWLPGRTADPRSQVACFVPSDGMST